MNVLNVAFARLESKCFGHNLVLKVENNDFGFMLFWKMIN